MGPEVQTRVQEALAELSPQLRTAARYLLANESEAAMNSMRMVAARAEVHPTTMLRLARKLGYRDWREIRAALQEQLRARTDRPLGTRARQLTLRPDTGRTQAIVDELFAGEEQNLRHTWQNLDSALLERAVAAMRGARRVYFLGRRSCYPVAFGLYYAFGMVRGNGHLVADDGAGITTSLASLTDADLLVAVGFTPYSHETVALTQAAREIGAQTLVISDTVVSPLAEDATFTFVVANDSPTLFQSILAAQAVAQTISAVLTAADGTTVMARLDAREARLDRFGAYWKEGENNRAKC